MEPATDEKTKRTSSPGGRPLLGSKGIGRFAAAKLGNCLELHTTAIADRASRRTQTTRVYGIDWEVFDTTQYLSDVEFRYEELEGETKPGTRLTISKLRNRWTKDTIDRLHREMRRLVSPLVTTDSIDFQIYLDLEDCTLSSCGFDGAAIVNGFFPSPEMEADPFRVRPFPILKESDYEVEGAFDEKGRFEGTLTIYRGGLKAEPIQLNLPVNPDIDESPCGTVLVHLFIFDRDGTAITQLAKRAGFGSAREARDILDSVAGIAIYRDKFRIRPYGDNDNDWLTLDRRRVQNPTTCIGHNQISGILVVDKDSRSGLVERSSREALSRSGGSLELANVSLARPFLWRGVTVHVPGGSSISWTVRFFRTDTGPIFLGLSSRSPVKKRRLRFCGTPN